MLNKTFKHHAWFQREKMTVNEFLDYVLNHSGDFHIKTETIARNNLLDYPTVVYKLSDGRYSMKLGYQERNYLAERNEYFASQLPSVDKNYMMAIIAASNEPIPNDGHDIVYFSR